MHISFEAWSANLPRDAVAAFAVDWGDGVVETLAGDATTASHVYAAPGAYTVSVTATDDDGDTSPAATLAVASPPRHHCSGRTVALILWRPEGCERRWRRRRGARS